MSDPRVRPFRPGDESGIRRLLERGFGRRLDESVWRWKLKQQSSPVENVWLAVDASDRPIFHYGGIPRALRLAAERRNIMVAVDSVTDPGFRRRGILTAGVEAAHRAWGLAGFAGVLGLPNEQWGSRVKALGWRPLVPLKWMIRPLRPERLLARRLGFPRRGTNGRSPRRGTNGISPGLDRLAFVGKPWGWLWDRRPDPAIEIREAERAEEGVGALSAACESEGLLMLARDREWLEWRYLSCPLYRYRMITARRAGRLAGYLVYRFDRESGFGFIAELLTRPEDVAGRRAVVGAAVERLTNLGAIGVAALAVPGAELHRTYRRAGFLFSWGSFPVHWVPLAGDPPMAALRDPRRWWLQGGDFDVL